jgi:Putative beta-barrel porin 2
MNLRTRTTTSQAPLVCFLGVGVVIALSATSPADAQTVVPPDVVGTGPPDGTPTTGADAYPGDGVRLSESALLHVGVVTEVGYDSNVFYDQGSTQSGILTVMPFFNVSNGPREGQSATRVGYFLGASLTYREYLSDDPNTKAQRSFNPTVSAGLSATTGQTGFSLSDAFSRTEEAPYGPALTSIKRDHNQGTARLRLTPGGGRIELGLEYRNDLDIFENDELSYADNMRHLGTIDLAWKWLPKTALYLDFHGGYIHYSNTSPSGSRTDSYPVGALIGFRGLVTPKLVATVFGGYETAYYGDKGRVTGAGTISAGLGLGYRIGLRTSATLGYGHGFRNSPIIGDYYNVDSVTLSVSHSLLARLIFGMTGGYEWRRYRTVDAIMPLDRQDHIVTGRATLDYYIQRWFYAGVGYTLTLNQSNIGSTGVVPLGTDYAKHQILGRIGFTY